MIYLISGLGANEKVFAKLDFQGRPFTHLPWLLPDKAESFEDYLSRFAERINQSEEIILIGTSFGGMVAQELARRLKVKKVIIISSIVSEKEFSPLMRWIRLFRIYKIVSYGLLLKMRP